MNPNLAGQESLDFVWSIALASQTYTSHCKEWLDFETGSEVGVRDHIHITFLFGTLRSLRILDKMWLSNQGIFHSDDRIHFTCKSMALLTILTYLEI